MFSKTSKYAIRSILYLAVQSSPGHKKGVDEIARELDIPKHFLAKILQQLSRDEVVSSTKGPNGGFYMDEKQLKSPLAQVIVSLEGIHFLEGCILGLPQCSNENPCPLHIQAMSFRDGLNYMIKNQNIGDLAKRIRLEHIHF